ncbi:MAG TPA: hypothetical protein VES38_06810 [Methylotenera sp.]|nr:hypothetical protein [Methylotenera sp.]
MSESIKQRLSALADKADAKDLRKLFDALLADLTDVRASIGGVLSGSAVYDTASLIDGAGATTTITVTGAALGDFAMVSAGVDLAGITVTAYVSAADTVSVRLQNESGGTLDLASTTLRARVLPQASFDAPGALTLLA